MRFLADENFRFDVIEFLKSNDHDIKRVSARSSDQAIAAYAKKEKRILLTNDSDFSMTLKFPPHEYPGFLIFRIHPPRFQNFKNAIEHFLALRTSTQIKGKTFILEENSFLEIE